MYIHGFIEKYCKDLIADFKQKSALIDFSDCQYDDIIEDESGAKTPVVYIDGNPVPVQDFFALDRKDFIAAYNTPSAGEIYDQYLDSYIILEGEDALNAIQNAIKAENARLEEEVALAPAW